MYDVLFIAEEEFKMDFVSIPRNVSVSALLYLFLCWLESASSEIFTSKGK